MKPLIALWLGIFSLYLLSCQNAGSQKHVVTDSTPSPRISFCRLLDSLPMVDRAASSHLTGLRDVTGNEMLLSFPQWAGHMAVAGVYVRNPGFTVVYIYASEGDGAEYLAAYDTTGQLLSAQVMGENRSASTNSTKTFVSSTTVFRNDSIIEVRTTKDSTDLNDHPIIATSGKLRLLKIGRDGQIAYLPTETRSFAEYLASFPKRKFPIEIKAAPVTSGLPPLSGQTPFMDYRDYITAYTLRFYQFASLKADHNFYMAIYANDEMREARRLFHAGSLLIVYSREGRETDRTTLYGGASQAMYENEVTSASIQANGTVRIKDKESSLIFEQHTENEHYTDIYRDYTLRVNKKGKLEGEINNFKVNCDFLYPGRFRKQLLFMKRSGDIGNTGAEQICWLPFKSRVGLLFHFFVDFQNTFGELLLVDKNLVVTDRLLLHNGLKTESLKSMFWKKVPKDVFLAENMNPLITLNKPMAIAVNGQSLLVTPQGKFVAPE
ncbi:hypothetical protein [Chitinophaga arvensicola]|uniref:Uncharacterized protein n=1 Tax=Chitinophaga arvensicola TaxID=29529 RepID=A0A1I0S519_9BACT|nr:hypothetical protein [Chitinophaga arvensicola]SEW49978.1 hypothetical protein SAMN04488122_3653 [Chitinophaga arvensicola]